MTLLAISDYAGNAQSESGRALFTLVTSNAQWLAVRLHLEVFRTVGFWPMTLLTILRPLTAADFLVHGRWRGGVAVEMAGVL